MSLKVREGKEEDRLKILEYFYNLDYYHVNNDNNLRPIKELKMIRKKLIDKCLNRDSKYNLLILEEKTAPIGFLIFNFRTIRNHPIIKDMNYCDLDYIYIKKEFRGLGGGKKLINMMINKIKDTNSVQAIYLNKYDKNSKFKPEKYGFIKQSSLYLIKLE